MRRHAYSAAAFSVLLVGAAVASWANAQTPTAPAARMQQADVATVATGGGASAAAMRLSSTQVQQVFQHIDGNRDGRLSRTEMGIYPRIERRFPGMDTDGDGAVSPVEFETALQQAS